MKHLFEPTAQAEVKERLRHLRPGSPSGVTTHPHGFFGRLPAQEWGVLMYKHLDHHLRQFGV